MSNPQIILTAGRCLKPVERWYNITEADKLSTKPTWVLYLYTDKSEYMLAIWQLTYTEKFVAAMKKGLRREWCNNGFQRGRAEQRTGIEKEGTFIFFTLFRLHMPKCRVCTVYSGLWQKFLQLCNLHICKCRQVFQWYESTAAIQWLESLNKICDVHKAT